MRYIIKKIFNHYETKAFFIVVMFHCGDADGFLIPSRDRGWHKDQTNQDTPSHRYHSMII